MKTKHIIIGLLLAQLSIPFVVFINALNTTQYNFFFYSIGPALLISLLATFAVAFPVLIILNYFNKLNYINIFITAWAVQLAPFLLSLLLKVERCDAVEKYSERSCLDYLKAQIVGDLDTIIKLIPGTLLAIVIFSLYKAYLTRRTIHEKTKD